MLRLQIECEIACYSGFLFESTHVSWYVFDPELSFAWRQGWSLLELRFSEEPVDDPEAKDVPGLRLPVDDDVVVLLEGLPDNHLLRTRGRTDFRRRADQKVAVNLSPSVGYGGLKKR